MQTFLPYPRFTQSAECLDYRRLGKQRVETKQILTALNDPNYGWQNHPATRMWRGYDRALTLYGISVCTEWRRRGYEDNLLGYFETRPWVGYAFPPWLGNEAFHASHRSNLLRKDEPYYRQFGWTEPMDLPYVWPH